MRVVLIALLLLLAGCSDGYAPASDRTVETSATTDEPVATIDEPSVLDCDQVLTELLRIQQKTLEIDYESSSASSELAVLTGDLVDLREQSRDLGCEG